MKPLLTLLLVLASAPVFAQAPRGVEFDVSLTQHADPTRVTGYRAHVLLGTTRVRTVDLGKPAADETGHVRVLTTAPFDGLAPNLYELVFTAYGPGGESPDSTPRQAFTIDATAPQPTGYTVAISPLTVAPNGSVTIAWTCASSCGSIDWVALFVPGSPNEQYWNGWYTYTAGRASGTVSTPPLPAGTYEARYLLNDGYQRVATSAPVVVGSAPAVECVVSAWSEWTATTDWGSCVNSQQTRTEQRTRTVVTAPANGGAACPALIEVRTVTQACTAPSLPAIDCVVSEWSAWSAWTAISSTTEQRTRTRTVVTDPSNGGLACPSLTESELRPIVTVPSVCVTAPLVLTINKNNGWPADGSGSQLRWTTTVNGVRVPAIVTFNPFVSPWIVTATDGRGCSATVTR